MKSRMRKVNQVKWYIYVLLLNAVHSFVVLIFLVWSRSDARDRICVFDLNLVWKGLLLNSLIFSV